MAGDHDELAKWGTVGARERLVHDLAEISRVPSALVGSGVDQLLDEAEEMSRRVEQDDILLTAAEVGDILRLVPRTVEKHMRDGQIPGFLVAGRWRCSRSELRRWIAEEHRGG